jgi:hypothetical protein
VLTSQGPGDPACAGGAGPLPDEGTAPFAGLSARLVLPDPVQPAYTANAEPSGEVVVENAGGTTVTFDVARTVVHGVAMLQTVADDGAGNVSAYYAGDAEAYPVTVEPGGSVSIPVVLRTTVCASEVWYHPDTGTSEERATPLPGGDYQVGVALHWTYSDALGEHSGDWAPPVVPVTVDCRPDHC